MKVLGLKRVIEPQADAPSTTTFCISPHPDNKGVPFLALGNRLYSNRVKASRQDLELIELAKQILNASVIFYKISDILFNADVSNTFNNYETVEAKQM